MVRCSVGRSVAVSDPPPVGSVILLDKVGARRVLMPLSFKHVNFTMVKLVTVHCVRMCRWSFSLPRVDHRERGIAFKPVTVGVGCRLLLCVAPVTLD